MKNNRYTNNIMIAYIVFLIVSLIVYIFREQLNFAFDNWNKIVVATTVSAAMFSLGSLFAFLSNIYKNDTRLLEYNIERINLLNEKERLIVSLFPSDDETILEMFKKSAEDNNNEIEENKKDIVDNEKKISRVSKFESFYNIFGFLLFFLIIVFDYAYNSFVQFQDELTMAAFIIMVIVNYITSREEMRHNEERKEDEDFYNDMLNSYESTIKEMQFGNEIIKKVREGLSLPEALDFIKKAKMEEQDGQVENGD